MPPTFAPSTYLPACACLFFLTPRQTGVGQGTGGRPFRARD